MIKGTQRATAAISDLLEITSEWQDNHEEQTEQWLQEADQLNQVYQQSQVMMQFQSKIGNKLGKNKKVKRN